MSVLESVERDLKAIAKRDKALADSALAAAARQLAHELDDPGNSATSKSMCAGRLMEAMDRLRELMPPEEEKDSLDEFARRRAERRGAEAAG